MTALEREIARTRRGLVDLLRRAATGSPDLAQAAQTLASTLEELEVSVEELEATNAQLAEAREELRRAYERYRDLFERAPEPFVVTYPEGTIRDANTSAARLFNTSLDELIGSPLARWFPLDQRPALRTALGAAAGGRTVRGIELTVTEDPQRRIVQASVDRVRAVHGDPEIRWVLADGTASVLARQHLAELLLSAEQQTDELRTTSAWQASLLGAAADDLIAPLAGVGTTLETLIAHGDSLDPTQRASLLHQASDETMKLRRLLPSLLELSQLQLRNGAARRASVSVRRMVADVLDRLALADHEVDLDVTVDQLLADPLELERILENLLSNAAQHAPPGSTIRVATRVVDASPSVLLLVEDEGPGVPPALRTHVFDPFVQVGDPADDDRAGLGLTIVAMFAAMHGGRAWVEDAPGGGASFRVLLPNAVD